MIASRVLVVVFFPLVAHGDNGYGARVFDLEQRHVAGTPEGNGRFAQKGAAGTAAGLAAGERKDFQQFDRLGNRGLGLLERGSPLVSLGVLIKRRLASPIQRSC